MKKQRSNMNEMNRYAIQQNDTGVNCFVVFGNLDAALRHFRQSLAAKLATEKRLLTASEKNEPFHLIDSAVEDNPTGDNEILQMQDFTLNEVCINRSDQFGACSDATTGAKNVLLQSNINKHGRRLIFSSPLLISFAFLRVCTIPILPSFHNL